MDRDAMLQTIDAAYAARQRGDKEAVAAFLAPNATFRLAGGTRVPDLLSDKPQYAAAIAECEKLMDLKPLKTVIRGTE